MNWVHRTIIIPDVIVKQMRELTSAFGPAAAGMFTAGLSATGEAPATHWISSGYIDEPFALALESYEAFSQLCESYGIPVLPEAEYDALLALLTVTDGDARSAMGDLKLV